MSGEAVVESAPVAESVPESAPSSAPQTTSDIAASVNRDLEAQAERESYGEAVEETPEAKPAAAAKPVELSEAAKFLLTKGHQAKKADGRDVWLPYGTVEKMLDAYVGQHRGSWDSRYTSLEQEAGHLRAFRDELLQDLKGEDPAQFLSKLAQFDPRYQTFLQRPSVEAKAAPSGDTKPEADIDLGNGMKTYSPDQNEKYIEWKARQIIQEALQPYEQERKQKQEQAAQVERDQRDRATARAQMAAVESEPDWAQHKDAVASMLAEDTEQAKASGAFKIRTIREALLLARNQYLAADDADKRKRWMDEANAAPKSTAVTRPGVEATFKAGAQRSTADLAREQAARLERGTR